MAIYALSGVAGEALLYPFALKHFKEHSEVKQFRNPLKFLLLRGGILGLVHLSIFNGCSYYFGLTTTSNTLSGKQ